MSKTKFCVSFECPHVNTLEKTRFAAWWIRGRKQVRNPCSQHVDCDPASNTLSGRTKCMITRVSPQCRTSHVDQEENQWNDIGVCWSTMLVFGWHGLIMSYSMRSNSQGPMSILSRRVLLQTEGSSPEVWWRRWSSSIDVLRKSRLKCGKNQLGYFTGRGCTAGVKRVAPTSQGVGKKPFRIQ